MSQRSHDLWSDDKQTLDSGRLRANLSSRVINEPATAYSTNAGVPLRESLLLDNGDTTATATPAVVDNLQNCVVFPDLYWFSY